MKHWPVFALVAIGVVLAAGGIGMSREARAWRDSTAVWRAHYRRVLPLVDSLTSAAVSHETRSDSLADAASAPPPRVVVDTVVVPAPYAPDSVAYRAGFGVGYTAGQQSRDAAFKDLKSALTEQKLATAALRRAVDSLTPLARTADSLLANAPDTRAPLLTCGPGAGAVVTPPSGSTPIRAYAGVSFACHVPLLTIRRPKLPLPKVTP